MALLSIRDLRVEYVVDDGVVRAVDGVDLEVGSRSIVGVLGESGCGKTTLAKAVLRALPENGRLAGEVRVDGESVAEMSDERLRELRWDTVAYVPQSAMGSLDPVYTVREQLTETIHAHRSSVSASEALDRVESALDAVDIDPSRLDDYPHQLSGGMRQRVLLAMALLLDPELLVADEPTTGLDALVRDEILADIETYRDEFGVSVVFVSHDVASLVETADTLCLMYGGKIVERGPSRELFEAPTHPYTIGLKRSLPQLHESPDELVAMRTEPPDLRSPPRGCRFVEACPYDVADCHAAHPEFREVRSGVESACYRADEAATMRDRATEVAWSDE